MPGNIIYRLDPLLICLILLGMLVAASELGFRVKKGKAQGGSDSLEKTDIALVLGAVVTLLALLLGFTYAMSEGRFEARRLLVIDEANAIGTTYLRAKTFPEPQSSEIQKLLHRYTALRIESASGTRDDPEKIRGIENQTKQLHSMIWSHAVGLSKGDPNPVVAVFLLSLNEMIDLHTKRVAAFRNRIPFTIYLVLFVVSVLTLWLVGHYFRLNSRRVRVLTLMLAFLVASVMWLIMDLDQPVRGAIRASQQSLFDLYRDMSQESQGTSDITHRTE